MTQEKKVQTAAVMDVTGVERAAQDAVRAARQMAEGIAREGEKAGKGLERMGDGAEKAERTVDAKTKSISDRIRRLTQQSQRELAALAAGSSGGAGSAAAVEFEGALRGADVSKLQPQIAALRELQTQVSALNAASGRANAGSAFLASLTQQAGAIGKTRAELAELKAAELGVSAQAAPMIAALKAADTSIAGLGTTSRATAAAMRTVPAQFTDIVVSLQAGQNPLQVLLQQGGQLKDQFGGIGPAAQALGGYVRGLVNPFTLAAAAALGLGAAFISGRNESGALQRALIESGGAAGVTADQLAAMSERIGDLSGSTTGGAVAALAQLAATGRVAGDSLERYAKAATALERAGGQTVEKSAEAFAALGREPVAASARLNEATNYLTGAVYRQIKALADQGRTVEAARLAQDAYANAIETRAPQMADSLGLVDRVWKSIAKSTGEALDALKAIGRAPSLDQQIEAAEKRLSGLQTGGDFGDLERAGALRGTDFAGQRQREIASAQAELQALRQAAAYGAIGAYHEGERTRQTRAAVEWERERDKLLTRQETMQREIAQAEQLGLAAGRSRVEIDSQIGRIREKYADKASGGRGLGRALLGEDLQEIRSAEQERAAVYRQSEAIIEAQRRAGLLSEAEYYAARRGFIELDAASKASALQGEIARLQGFKGTAAEEAQARRDLAAATGKLNQVRTEAAGRAAVLNLEEQALIDSAKAELQITRDRAAAEIERIRTAGRDYQAMSGMGGRQREEYEGQIQLQAEFTRRVADLEADRLRGRYAGREDAYRAELTQLITEEGSQLQALRDFNRLKREADENAAAGFSRGLGNVIEGTSDLGARTARLTEDAFGQLGDALTDVFTKGKADWRGLEQTILQGITRIIVEQQLIRPIAQFLQGGSAGGGFLDKLVGGALSAVFGGSPLAGATGFGDYNSTALLSGQRANGGPVERGGLYEINETGRGPGEVLNVGGRQYLMAMQGGYVKPVADSAASGGRVLNQTVHFHVNGAVDRRTQQQLAAETGRMAQTAMARNG